MVCFFGDLEFVLICECDEVCVDGVEVFFECFVVFFEVDVGVCDGCCEFSSFGDSAEC